MANIAGAVHDRMEHEKWRKVGTKQTRPLHQTANFEVVCSRRTFRTATDRGGTRSRRESERKRNGKEKKKREANAEKATANGAPHVTSFPASSRVLLLSLLSPTPGLVRYLF